MAEDNLSPEQLMFWAIKEHDNARVRYYLSAGMRGDVRIAFDNATCLHQACLFNNIEAVQILLNLTFAPNINAQTLNGDCALKIAAERGHAVCVQLLLEAKQFQPLDPNLRGAGGWTPLMAACACNRTACVKLLLSLPSIELDWFDFAGHTAAQLAPTQLIRDLIRETAAARAAVAADIAARRAKFEADQIENATSDVERRSLRDHHARFHDEIERREAAAAAQGVRSNCTASFDMH